MKTILFGLLFAGGCGTRTPLDLGPGSDADGDADADGDSDGDADSPTCDEICFRIDFCDVGHLDDCTRGCPLLRDALTPQAFETIYGDCIELDCDEIEDCADEGPSHVAPLPFHRAFCEDACGRLRECNADDDERDCMDQCLSPEGDPAIPTLSEAMIDDLSACFDGACDDLEGCFEGVIQSWLPDE